MQAWQSTYGQNQGYRKNKVEAFIFPRPHRSRTDGGGRRRRGFICDRKRTEAARSNLRPVCLLLAATEGLHRPLQFPDVAHALIAHRLLNLQTIRALHAREHERTFQSRSGSCSSARSSASKTRERKSSATCVRFVSVRSSTHKHPSARKQKWRRSRIQTAPSRRQKTCADWPQPPANARRAPVTPPGTRASLQRCRSRGLAAWRRWPPPAALRPRQEHMLSAKPTLLDFHTSLRASRSRFDRK